MTRVSIDAFDRAPAATAAEILRACANIDAWVADLVAARPYGTADALVRRADALAADWTQAEVAAALADHPRIGERPAAAGRSAAMSEREQSSVGSAIDLADRLVAGNAAYEQRFGRIFLIRAAGRSAEEIVAQLELRLDNAPAAEWRVTMGQLREIAQLRLQESIT